MDGVSDMNNTGLRVPRPGALQPRNNTKTNTITNANTSNIMIQQKCGSCYILGATTQIGKSKVAEIVRLHLLIEAAILSLYFSPQNLHSDLFLSPVSHNSDQTSRFVSAM